MMGEKRIISTRENFREIETQNEDLYQWARSNKEIFQPPDADEAAFITQIYSIPHFRSNIEQQKLWKGGINADSFVIAKAFIKKGTVVTGEKKKPNAAKIPNICDHFHIPCLDLESFMEKENWTF
jgi:hypothetical protein